MAKILIADDEPEVRATLKRIVEAAGHSTMEAYDGLNALECIQEFNPDVVLLDWMLPELFGGEVLDKLRRAPEYQRHSHVKVIVVSDFADDKSIQEFRRHGANEFVIKVDNPDQLKGYLLARLTELLGKTN